MLPTGCKPFQTSQACRQACACSAPGLSCIVQSVMRAIMPSLALDARPPFAPGLPAAEPCSSSFRWPLSCFALLSPPSTSCTMAAWGATDRRPRQTLTICGVRRQPRLWTPWHRLKPRPWARSHPHNTCKCCMRSLSQPLDVCSPDEALLHRQLTQGGWRHGGRHLQREADSGELW